MREYYDPISERARERSKIDYDSGRTGFATIDPLTPVEQHDVVSAIAYGELPLYRAQYECRHCLERFTEGDHVTEPIVQACIITHQIPRIAHNCTPDIIGVADLQCFVKQ